MEKPLVSIITPCYNGEKTIARLMDSVLNQTYKKIEFILVNDGSTDNTESIVKSYEQKFAEQGMLFKYVYQENQGLGGAINTGLKHFTGEFLCWPDADDYLEIDSVYERVNFLIQNPKYAIVTSNAYIRKEDNLENPRLLVKKVTEGVKQENQFNLMLNGDSVFCSGCHMVRTEAFLEVNPNRSIYPAKRGQNWQMLLPIYFNFNRYFLDKPLYNYIIYNKSMSSRDNSAEKLLLRYNEHEELLNSTLKQIEKTQNVDLSKYFKFIADKYFKLRMRVALKQKKSQLFIDEYVKKQNCVGLDNLDRMFYLQNKFPILYSLHNKLGGAKDCYVEKIVIKKLNRSNTQIKACHKLVSVIIPCYNGAKFLDYCFDSILRQSYKNIELVIVNDGSTDNSEEIILGYKTKIEEKGYIFKYIKQENQGAAAAVNTALKVITGEFLMLYDVDDILFNDCVKEKAEFLHNHSQYAMVRNNGYYVTEKKRLGKHIFINSNKELKNTNIFVDLLKGTTNNWPGSYMVRTAVLFEALSGREIYTSAYGQNLQIMMPVALASKSGFINKPLMKYFIHSQSHSHYGGRERALERLNGYESNRYGVLKQLNLSKSDYNKYTAIVKNKFDKSRINFALSHKDKELFDLEYANLTNKKCFYKLLWLLTKVGILAYHKRFWRLTTKVKNALKSYYYVNVWCHKNTKNY